MIPLQREGLVAFRAHAAGGGRGPGTRQREIFYNPAMALSRDLNVALLRHLGCRGRGLDGMAGCGVRGLRLAVEASLAMEFCDRNPAAAGLTRANCAAANIAAAVHHDDVRALLHRHVYHYVDLDPFGTPAPFLAAAVAGLRGGGLLAVTATDTAVLCGAKPRVCRRRYGATPLRGIAAKEAGLRILIGAVVRHAAAADRGTEVALAYAEGHHLRAYLRLPRGAQRGDAALARLGWLAPTMEVLTGLAPDAAGPLWLGPLGDAAAVPPTPPSGADERDARRLTRLLDTLREELPGPPGLHDPNLLAREAGAATPRRDRLIATLRGRGFFASASHFDPVAVRTDAPHAARLAAVRESL